MIPERFLVINLLVFLLIPVIIMFYSPGSLLQTLATTLTGIIYITTPLILLMYIPFQGLNYDPFLITALFVIIWIYDSLAYLTGSIAGRTKLAPKISPSKSWEGFAGGVILTVVLIWLGRNGNIIHRDIPWIAFSLILIVSATLGDLFESTLKRRAGVKDSGSLIPGHGGILDRFDSVLFAAPVAFVFLRIICEI